MTGHSASSLLAALAAASFASLAWKNRNRLPGDWERINHRGETITMAEGPAWALGALGSLAVTPGQPTSHRLAALLSTTAGVGFGAIDDLAETGKSKGLKGHLGALATGQLTTGALKIIGISGSALVAAAILHRPPDTALGFDRCSAGYLADVVISGGVIAGTANLINLLDLRPGRALKVVSIGAALMLARQPGAAAGAALGACAALLRPDLTEQAMLGDSGANAAGALLGTAIVTGASRTARLATLAGLVGLTLASEKVSFTAVIERTPGLRELDSLGRPSA